MMVKTRIALIVVGTGFIASLLFSIVVFFELIEQPFRIMDNVLEEEANRIVKIIIFNQQKADFPSTDTLSWGLDRYWVKVYDEKKQKVIFRSHLAEHVYLAPMEPGSATIARATIPNAEFNLDQNQDQKVSFWIRIFRIVLYDGAFIVQIARPMEKLYEKIWELILGIFSGLVFSTLVLTGLSRFVAGKILQPIGKMNDLTRNISEKNLQQRIPHGQGGDEFSQLARTINHMLDRLQNSFQTQREFLFDTSHELKTPLTTMRLAVDEMITSTPHDLANPVNENLNRLRFQVLRMERLVKELLILSSLETEVRLDRKPVQLTSLLLQLIEDYRFLAEPHNISLNVWLPEQIVVSGDEEKLRRAFSNILDNAVKYNNKGGRIELKTDQSAIEWIFSVTNTGPGVPKTELPKVFDPFYRMEKSRSIEHGGTGLGLAIVKKIIELHHGTVTFESQETEWTRVRIHLPRYLGRDEG